MKIIRAFKSLLKKNPVCRTTYNQLQRMSDRELSDIGICRGDIRRVASMASVIERREQF